LSGGFVSVVFAFFIAAAVSACGGGGGGGGSSDTSISLSQTSLAFNAEQNAAAPAAQTITATFQGDGVVVGTLPGQQAVAWLAIAEDSRPASNQVVFRVSVAPGALAPGAYSTTVRIASGHADGSAIKYVDVTISLTIAAGFGASGGPLSFTEIDGDPAGPQPSAGYTEQIQGDNISWHATADQPWIVLGAAAGTVKGPLNIKVLRGSLALGTHTGTVSIADDRSGRTVNVPVTYAIQPPGLSVDKTSLSFTVTLASVPGDLSAPVQISDQLNGLNGTKGIAWKATSDQPWLAISAVSGSTSPPAVLTVGIDVVQMGLMPSGTYMGNVGLTFTDAAGTAGSVRIPVTFKLRMPLARAATPYLVSTTAPTTVLVRGEDLQAADLASLQLDGAALAIAPTFVNGTSISLTLPALAAGRHLLTFSNGIGSTRSAAEVTSKLLVTPTTSVVESPNTTHLLYDPERTRLYAVDRTDALIKRFEWNGTTWTTLTSLVVPQLRDAALTRSGRELVITTDTQVLMSDATDITATPRIVANITDVPGYFPSFDQLNYVVVADSGMAFIAQSFNGSGSTPLLGFDTIRERWVTTSGPMGKLYYEGRIAASDDGHYVIAGGEGLSPAAEAGLIDSRGDSTIVFGIQLTYPVGNFEAFDLGADGSKVLESFVSVKNRSGNLLGSLPFNNFARFSPDTTRAYAWDETVAPGKLNIYDLTVTPYAKSGEVALPSRIADPTYAPVIYPRTPWWVSGALSPDGKAMFLAGPERIVVVTLP